MENTKLLMQLEDRRVSGQMATLDGRIFMFSKGHETNSNEQLVLADLFHGAIRAVTFDSLTEECIFTQIEIIEPGLFLIIERNSRQLILFQTDYSNLEVKIHDVLQIGKLAHGDLLLDTEDSKRFIVVLKNSYIRSGKLPPGAICGKPAMTRGHFRIGHITESNKLTLDEQKPFEFASKDFKKLKGNKLHYLQHIWEGQEEERWEFCEFDLTELKESKRELSMILQDGKAIKNVQTDCCAWSNDDVYLTSKVRENLYRILKLDTKNLVWTDTGIRIPDWITEMFVDKNEILTMRAEDKRKGRVDFYRFPLRNPDSLKNLSWFTSFRKSKFGKNKLYQKIVEKLPPNNEFRCRISYQ